MIKTIIQIGIADGRDNMSNFVAEHSYEYFIHLPNMDHF